MNLETVRSHANYVGLKMIVLQHCNTRKEGETNPYSIFVHRLVLTVFAEGDPSTEDEPYECDHIDGDPSNNHISNLQWLTRKEHKAKTSFAKSGRPQSEWNGNGKGTWHRKFYA